MQLQPCDAKSSYHKSYHIAENNCLCNVRRVMVNKRSFPRRTSDKCHQLRKFVTVCPNNLTTTMNWNHNRWMPEVHKVHMEKDPCHNKSRINTLLIKMHQTFCGMCYYKNIPSGNRKALILQFLLFKECAYTVVISLNSFSFVLPEKNRYFPSILVKKIVKHG